MEPSTINRRRFSQLAAAAFGGLLAGSQAEQAVAQAQSGGQGAPAEKNPLLSDPHVCRGLNTCKGKGKSKDNACAGQGSCATARAHTCHAANDCRGQGGCGASPGENSCRSKGACGVPLSPRTWKKARKRFEEIMAKDGKKFGPAPAGK
jgi:hypothetical protein